jgi:hypothetical protein
MGPTILAQGSGHEPSTGWRARWRWPQSSRWSAGISAQGPGPSAHPRTPWGDPDLQGHYTNKYEYGTPFERPAAFDGRRVEEITGKELAAVIEKRQQEALDRAPFFGGDPEGKIGNSAEFRDIYEVTKGSRAWFVTDPADGRIPPLVPDARARMAEVGRGGSFGAGPFNGPEDFSLWERCITRGLPGSMLPGGYGNSYEIVQGPGVVAIRYEMVHETRVIPLDGRPHLGKAVRSDLGDARGHWEVTPRDRDDELPAAGAFRGGGPTHCAGRWFRRTAPTRSNGGQWMISTWTRS